ncbi:type II/IV secretion system protein, partial [bacterium]|nr:type II/IV secretion system protein [bacterium]
MSMLSTEVQKQVEDALLHDNVLNSDKLKKYRTDAQNSGEPLFTYLVNQNVISSETLTKTIAHVANVPYVNLSNARIDPKILSLLPVEVAERYMAVPLGEMQNRLVVAMLDADNVQAVDFLSNKIGRPLKVYSASEEGIRQVLQQYVTDLDKEVGGALEDEQNEIDAAVLGNVKNIKTIVQDSPISKALTTLLDYAAT